MKIAKTLTSLGTFRCRQDFIPNSLDMVSSFVVVESCAAISSTQAARLIFPFKPGRSVAHLQPTSHGCDLVDASAVRRAFSDDLAVV